jgi:hypothetical protein
MVSEEVREGTKNICKLCAPKRREEGLDPNFLIRLNPTAHKNLEVLVCPNCDGIT